MNIIITKAHLKKTHYIIYYTEYKKDCFFKSCHKLLKN